MPIPSKGTIPLNRARATLKELCDQVKRERGEKILTKHGKSCVALIDVERLDYYHRMEREHVHLILLGDTLRGVEAVNAGKTLSVARLKARYRR